YLRSPSLAIRSSSICCSVVVINLASNSLLTIQRPLHMRTKPYKSCSVPSLFTRVFTSAACTHPLVYFGQLKLPQPPHTMCRQSFKLSPSIHSVLSDSQMLGNVLGSNPLFCAHIGKTLF